MEVDPKEEDPGPPAIFHFVDAARTLARARDAPGRVMEFARALAAYAAQRALSETAVRRALRDVVAAGFAVPSGEELATALDQVREARTWHVS